MSYHTRQTIRVHIPGWGSSTVTPEALDQAIADYLPASPAELRATAKGRGGGTDSIDRSFDSIDSVSAFLVILADWDHNTDSSPLGVH